MSSLAWIDFDEAERQRAQRIMALFQERESRDELGLGAIRDSIADHLFPGTSTIQTRLRYMLFIPWLFRTLEGRDVPESQLRTEARALEIRLADALKAGGESNGIIGRDAGPRLQRLPSSVYWAGLGAWGIRLFPGSIDSLFISLRGLKWPRVSSDSEDAAAGSRAAAIWNPALPQAPNGLLDCAAFSLTADEAQFIIDRLVATQPAALLTMLARDGIDAECDHIWTHPHLASFPADARRLVRHGEIFSHVMHGAALLYNLALSELRGRDDWVADYRERIAAWAAELDLSVVRNWTFRRSQLVPRRFLGRRRTSRPQHPARGQALRGAVARTRGRWHHADCFRACGPTTRGRAGTPIENQSIALRQPRRPRSLDWCFRRRPPELSLEPGEIAFEGPGSC